MKIAYHAISNPQSDRTEEHIKKAFEDLGHEVVMVEINRPIPTCDFVLFHKDIPKTTQKKVCWYFDKIDWSSRELYLRECLREADHVFVTDKTWADTLPQSKLHVLRQGAGLTDEGQMVRTDAQIGFTASLYGSRHEFAGRLAEHYGDKFQVFTKSFNEDLNNLCATVPILVAPKHPSDDNYWSSRVYLTLGAGGFLLHPYLKGLRGEYGEDELVMYKTEEELYEKIDYYLKNKNEREKIRIKGWQKTKDNFTYKDRVCSLIATLQKK